MAVILVLAFRKWFLLGRTKPKEVEKLAPTA